MAESRLPTNAEGWQVVAQAAAQLTSSIRADELLLVRDASGQPLRPSGPPAGKSSRLGAVLLLLYPQANDLRLPLTIRSEQLASHSGEVSLPGGATDPTDTGPIATALRECEEEIGVAAHGVEIWGQLAPVYIVPSNFQITPVVAYTQVEPQLHVNPAEVSGVITVSLRELLDPATVVVERRTLHNVAVDVPFLPLKGKKCGARLPWC